ncbi:hypothetical protein DVH24_000519 [Malus domestica]|uniref:Uncharacterized protein n=1 Tax=Malus domestica TaxID=3750 RepID=A0A498J074_MALDO|nr:hypothetical protein DVH24_000519 [Malus domestica]
MGRGGAVHTAISPPDLLSPSQFRSPPSSSDLNPRWEMQSWSMIWCSLISNVTLNLCPVSLSLTHSFEISPSVELEGTNDKVEELIIHHLRLTQIHSFLRWMGSKLGLSNRRSSPTLQVSFMARSLHRPRNTKLGGKIKHHNMNINLGTTIKLHKLIPLFLLYNALSFRLYHFL